MTDTQARIAVLVPCYNEEAAIALVVRDFRAALPDAAIYVYDNNSSDKTAERAREAGAIVAQRDAAGQRQCGAAHVRRHRSGHLCAGGWRRHL